MRLTTAMATWTSTTQRRLVAALLVLVVIGVGALLVVTKAFGLLSSTTSNSGDTFGAGPCFGTVSMTNNVLTPATVTIRAGACVKWTNNGSNVHTTKSDSGIWDSGNMSTNATYTRTFSTVGNYPYKCNKHPALMIGTITVTA